MFDLLPRFSAAAFAVAGLAFAAGPIIIHLLNRRRFRVLSWAAMDFLREALQRNRRILRLRDLLLLLMRCAAVLLFGLALAQPYMSVDEEQYDASQPLHAVLVVDNSMSMGYYDTLDGTLLDTAVERAEQFIDKLPRGSRISIVPLCGSSVPISSDAYRTPDDAIEALNRIEIVDRAGSLDLAANKARSAAEAEPSLAQRVVFFSDQQAVNWRDNYSSEDLKQLPPMQLVDVSPAGESDTWIPSNTWIAGLEIQDGVADVETPATIVVRLSHDGTDARHELPVTLTYLNEDGEEEVINSKTVTLDPGTRNRELTFQYTFVDVQPVPGKPVFVPIKASIPHDSLRSDDEYHMMAPVVAALPVVFIDQLTVPENTIKGDIGETYHLRRLLAPVTRRNDGHRQLVKIRHFNLEGLAGGELQSRLKDARLVVIAGIRAPGEQAVDVLRQYVEQGGQLVIAAGGAFDPQLWNDVAWRNGAGILPTKLDILTVGQTPDQAGADFTWFALQNKNHGLLAHHYFHMAGNSPEDLARTYAEPVFFKAVKAIVDDDVQQEMLDEEVVRLRDAFAVVGEIESRRQQREKAEATGKLSDEEEKQREADEDQLRQLRPQWLMFARSVRDVYDEKLSDVPSIRDQQLRTLATRTRPRRLAEFDNGLPFLIERTIGRGHVILVTTGLLPQWNTLAKTNAMSVIDRMLRTMIDATVPRHNYPPTDEIEYPVGDDRDVQFAVYRPGREGAGEPVDAGFVAADQRAVTVRNALTRGVYRLAAYDSDTAGQSDGEEQVKWQTRFAVRGLPHESELAPLTRAQFDARRLGDQLRWVGENDTISLAGAQIRGQNWWMYLIVAVLILLLIELLVLAWPAVRRKREEMAAP